jgi:hypothetical protein
LPDAAVALFDIEPDLIRFLSAEHRENARRVPVPVRQLERGGLDVTELLGGAGCFGAIVLDGMLLHNLQLGDRSGARLLGRGDLISLTHFSRSMLIGEDVCRAVAPTRLAMLGVEVLRACQRWPQITAGLYARSAEQAERIVAQLMICQLPKVEDRVLAMLWLLAEAWGRVGHIGTELPVALTHEMIGALVGARRSTVTLALRDLTDRGSLLRQEEGWLLLDPPPGGARPLLPDEPRLVRAGSPVWRTPEAGAPEPERPPEIDRAAFATLLTQVERLRERHASAVEQNRAFLAATRSARERSQALREQLRGLSAPTAPSS